MKCTICNNETKIIYDKQFNLHYHKCSHCELIQLDPNEKISFNEERAIYDTHENSIEHEGYVNFFKKFLEIGVFPYKNSGTLLDFGSGPEPVLTQVINRDYNFETSHYDLHYAPEKSYLNQTYDVIVSTEVIEHVDQPLSFMKHLAEHVSEDGIIAIMTLFHSMDDENFMDWWYRRDETHITFYTPKTMEVLAKLCCLQVIQCDDTRIVTFSKK